VILRLLGILVTLVAGGLVAGSLLLFSELDRALVLDAYLVLVGAVALNALARSTAAATSSSGPSAFDEALRPRRAGVEPPERLLRLEGLVSLSSAAAGDFHFGLRPHLREAAAARLLSHRGVHLDTEPERAAAVLGADAWELVRPDRPVPADRFNPGPSPAALARAVEAIERIGR
jgi:hypothetical protein